MYSEAFPSLHDGSAGRFQRVQAVGSSDKSGLLMLEVLTTTEFENHMALQSVHPIFIPVEMLGEPGPHNDLAPEPEGGLRPGDKMAQIAPLHFTEEQSKTNEERHQGLFRHSYEVITAAQVTPSHHENALAH